MKLLNLWLTPNNLIKQYFSLLLFLLKGPLGLGNAIEMRKIIKVHLHPFGFVSTLSMGSFSPTCVHSLSIYQWSDLISAFILLAWMIQVLVSPWAQNHTWQFSRCSRMATQRNLSLELLQTPSWHHIMATNPLGLLCMAQLFFHQCTPNLWASAYPKNHPCLSQRADALSYSFLLF